MAVRIAVGGENFETLRKNGSYYVDKTELLYELVQQKNNAVTLFTRDERWQCWSAGKQLRGNSHDR